MYIEFDPLFLLTSKIINAIESNIFDEASKHDQAKNYTLTYSKNYNLLTSIIDNETIQD